MKSTKVFCFWVAAALFLSGCAKEPVLKIENDGDRIPLNISSSINQEHTKATAEGFADKDALGLFAVNWTENNAHPGTLQNEGNQADNVKYVFDWSNQKWNPVKPVYYKDINTHADLFLYYPYLSSINDVAEANFEVKQDQSKPASGTELSGYEASDFLWGKGENITPTQSRIAVPMSHRLSAVLVVLQEKPSGSGFAEDEFASLDKSAILTNTTRKATIDFSTGTASPLGSAQLTGIVMCPQEDNSFRAIAIPQTVAGGKKLFSITIGGQSYSYETTSDAVFEPGKMSKFTLNVTKKTPSGDYAFELADLQIIPWVEDRNSHGGEARQYFVVNVTEPGTLGATIKAMGKNPDKIKNLKVVGNVRDDDFYFMRDSMAILEAVNMKESEIKTSEGEGAVPNSAFCNKKSLCYFVFPEYVKSVGSWAFSGTMMSGPLSFNDGLVSIGDGAFAGTSISQLSLPESLINLGESAFNGCSSLSGDLLIPSKITIINSRTFYNCSFNGKLELPISLITIGEQAFDHAGRFLCDLVIPEGVENIPRLCFFGARFSGKLILKNVKTIEDSAFDGCGFSGELVLPEGLVSIGQRSFYSCGLSSVVFPSTLKNIESVAFMNNGRLQNKIILHEGLISIGKDAFTGCYLISGLELPSSIQTIQEGAFTYCYNISSIICYGTEPADVLSGAFNDVAKDNFTVEVPAQSVKRYQAEPGWSDFKRIAAHYDFSVSRERMRALNAAQERKYTLRAPANFNWSIQNKPEWVSVSPESGTGKTDIIITVEKMDRTSETFEVNEGTYNNPSYKNYKGRSGEIVFQLDEDGVDYTCSFEIEQYDSNYSDGQAVELQKAAKDNGINIIFVGDGYDAKDIAKETFISNANEGYEAFFNIEPYKTYKDYFNVYAVVSQSDDSGIGTVNTVVDTKFGTYFTQNRIKVPESEPIFTWAKKADAGIDFTKALVINLMNTSAYEGICAMYGDGSAIAFCPVSRDAYPYDFRGIIQHEAGGHGFGKLGDEYIYHSAFIQTCGCPDDCDHPQSDNDTRSSYGKFKSLGWYKNLSMNGDMHQVPWAHLIYNPNYSNYVDVYEGGYMHSRGVYRSEATSCMNNNIPYYSAISRQAMVERILEISGEGFTLEKFYAKDKDDFGTVPTKAYNLPSDRTYGVDPLWNRGSEEGSVVYMGEHPDYSKIK